MTIVLALVLAPACGAHAQFICDLDPWNESPDSAFGAGAGEVRGFAVTSQNVPDECLVSGVSYLNGVIINATQQGGSSTMPIEFVEIQESSLNGPPGPDVLTSGPGGNLTNVPPFPAFVTGRMSTRPTTWAWDLDDDGTLDSYAAGTAFLDGNNTPGQFFPISTNGPVVPCHTGLQGMRIDEPCVNGNPDFRSIGLGVETAAGLAVGVVLGVPLELRTNNPEAAGDFFLDIIWDQSSFAGAPPAAIDALRVFDGTGGQICEFPNVPPGSPRSCLLTPTQIQQFLEGELDVEFDEDDQITRAGIIPANDFIFADGFESGDTTSWSNTVP